MCLHEVVLAVSNSCQKQIGSALDIASALSQRILSLLAPIPQLTQQLHSLLRLRVCLCIHLAAMLPTISTSLFPESSTLAPGP